MPPFSTLRARVVLSVIVGLLVTLCGRVAYLQTYGRETTISRAERQQHQSAILPARRGSLFDRNGNLIAGSVVTQTLFIDPKFMTEEFQHDGHTPAELDAALARLAAVLDRRPESLKKLLADKAGSRFVRVAQDLDPSACDAIAKLDLPGVGVVPASRRVYPMGSLACHILGGVGGDGAGIEGIELRYDKILAGKDGFERLTRDAHRHPIGVDQEDYLPPQHGQHIVLSIDSTIQMIATEELADTCTKFKAKRGEVIVMDPRTGEVLALANWMADYPGFNPQNLGDSPPEARLNRAIAVPYEPGSIFKPFIASPAFMWGVTTPWEVWPVKGQNYFAPDGRHVRDDEPYHDLTTWDGLVRSSNIVMSMLGERLGNPRLHTAITSFGFGQPTGIDLPGENGGLVRPLRKWSHQSTESVSQGYEVMVTPLQMCRAFCVIANGGKLVQPRLVKGILDPDGNVLSQTPHPDFEQLPQVLTPETAAEVRRILSDVVIRGTANGCRNLWWNISGKTGTSHISEGLAGYSRTRYNSSFIACAPMEDAKLVVAFVVHEPNGSTYYGGKVAAPGACRILARSLAYMEVPASPPLALPPAQVADKLWLFKPSMITDRTYGSKKAG